MQVNEGGEVTATTNYHVGYLTISLSTLADVKNGLKGMVR